MMRVYIIGVLTVLLAGAGICDPVPTTLNDFFLPGSQPGESGNLEHPSKCDNCHGGYDIAVEPAFNWRGSMMAQAARDPLFYACLAIAEQDAPASGDLCIRCHSPAGWLEGRSTPTDGSALNNNDREGVQCDFCHKAVTPTPLGVNPYPDDPDYTADTYDADQGYLATITAIPAHSANGMYIADSDNAKRGPFVDANATHQMFYSPFHAEAAICGTCHDVSNPAFSRNPDDTYSPNDLDQPAPSFSPYDQFPIERTYSEWLMSAYNTPEGIYAPQFGGNKDTVATCQDCHMRDVSGVACNKSNGVYRDDLPHHDLTGGNTFIPLLIDAVFPGESEPAALDSGIARAESLLKKAATMDATAAPDGNNHLLNVRVINETGHKLPSGYPEGRRIWISVRAYNQNSELIYESGAYDAATGTLSHDADAKIYEIKPGIAEDVAAITGYAVGPSFHFAVNSKIYYDNRIPPRGFTNAKFDSIQSPPVGYSYADGQYWDDTEYLVPGAAARIIVTLYYQTTSKEYVEFLRDENVTNDWGDIFYGLWDTNGKSVPVAMNVDTVDVTPLQGNSPPTLATIGNKSTDENVNLNFTVTANDPDGDIPSLTATGLPTGATFTDHEDGTAAFDWTPTYEQSGVYSVTFTAEDDSGATDSEIIDITVNNVNRPPVLAAIGNKETDENVNLTFIITGSDPDGTIPDLTVSGLPSGAAFTDHENGTATFDWTPTFDQAGTYPVVFHAIDDSLAADSEEIQITVDNINRPPVLDSIGPKSTDEGVNLNFTVTGSDPDGTIPDLTVSGLPSGATFTDHEDGTATFDWTPTFEQAGTYPVVFHATDDSLAVDSEEIQITVNNVGVNDPPVLDPIGAKAVDENAALNFTVSASDPDGTIPDLTVSGLPSGATFADHEDGTATFDWTPTFDQAGTYPVVFRATDDSLATDSEIVDITVNNVNRTPELDTIPKYTVPVDSTLTFDISASDPDGTIPVLTATSLPPGSDFVDHNNGTGTFTWTPIADDAGVHQVVFHASDGEAVDSQQVEIEVISTYLCGDANGDGDISVSDATYIINYIFKSGPAPDPLCIADANGSGDVAVSDATYLVNYIFKSGPPPVDDCCP